GIGDAVTADDGAGVAVGGGAGIGMDNGAGGAAAAIATGCLAGVGAGCGRGSSRGITSVDGCPTAVDACIDGASTMGSIASRPTGAAAMESAAALEVIRST